jgi:hypothetical protein
MSRKRQLHCAVCRGDLKLGKIDIVLDIAKGRNRLQFEQVKKQVQGCDSMITPLADVQRSCA